MSTFYKTARGVAFISVIITSVVVLGLAGNFGRLFLPSFHRPFVIFTIIVPSLTILFLIFLLLRSQPRFDLAFLFLFDVLWLAMGAWSTDMIGNVECFPLGSQRIPIEGNKTMSYQQYCYEMKSIEAFSWANFGMLLIAFIITIVLIIRVLSWGRYTIWQESISELPWFGQYQEGYGLGHGRGYPTGLPVYTGGSGQPYYVQQNPGQSLVIQPNANGPPTVTTI